MTNVTGIQMNTSSSISSRSGSYIININNWEMCYMLYCCLFSCLYCCFAFLFLLLLLLSVVIFFFVIHDHLLVTVLPFLLLSWCIVVLHCFALFHIAVLVLIHVVVVFVALDSCHLQPLVHHSLYFGKLCFDLNLITV